MNLTDPLTCAALLYALGLDGSDAAASAFGYTAPSLHELHPPTAEQRQADRARRRKLGATLPSAPKPQRVLPAERRCNACGEIKPAAQFYVEHGDARLSSWCRGCQRARNQRRRAAERDAGAMA
jgi:hypothetical protein